MASTARTQQAYQLGSRDRLAGRPALDLDGDESARLMDELGETGPTTARNVPAREAMCDAYEDGWHDAR